MGRLIDDDVLIEKIVNTPTEESGYNPVYLNGCATRQNEIIDFIVKQPTAFDVEAVVNVVREAGAKLCCNKSCNNNCDCCVVDDALRTIIDAIRKGGVNHD